MTPIHVLERMIRTSILDDIGDLAAEPGSRPWAMAVCLDIQATLNDIDGDAQHLRVMVNLIREHQGYRKLNSRKGYPFTTFEAFCVAPQPFGLGYAKADIDAIVREREEKQSPEKRAHFPSALNDRPGPEAGTVVARAAITAPISDVVKNRCSESGGNAADYLTARIARDRPDILDRMKAGEFPSVRKAAMEAGIVNLDRPPNR